MTPSAVQATAITWANAGEGDWNNGANWTGGVVPSSATSDVAQIDNGGTADITAAQGAQSVGSITLGTTSSSSGNLKITGGSITTTTSDIRIGGNSSSVLSAVGNLTQTGGDIIMNAGNLNIGLGSTSTGATPSQGTYTISNGSLTIASNVIMAVGNRGTGTVNQSGGTIYVKGNAANATTTLLQLGRNTASVPATGTYTLSDGKAVAANFLFGNAVQTSNTFPTNTFNLQGTGILRTGIISIINTAATNNFNFTGGTLTANTINLPTLTNAGGTLSPATLTFSAQANPDDVVTSAIGTMTINGNYNQTAGTMALDLASLSSFDSVLIPATKGSATIGGALAVATLNGYDPAPGDSFDVVTADSITWTGSVNGLTPSGNSYDASVLANGSGQRVLRLTVVPEPTALGVIVFGAALLRHRARRA